MIQDDIVNFVSLKNFTQKNYLKEINCILNTEPKKQIEI